MFSSRDLLMARRTSRGRSVTREREARQTRGAILKIGGVFAAVLTVGAAYIGIASSRPKLDPETLCPAKPASVTVLLVDVTDPMNAPQRQDFANQLERLKNSIPRYGKLIVTKVGGGPDGLLSPVIVRCNPGTAADENEATGAPAKLQKQWDEGFNAPLNQAFEQIAQASGAEQSPILESIQSVALTEFQKPAMADKPRQLIVASDLLQHTSSASFYRGLPDPGAFVGSEAFRKARTDLRGVKVELWMLQRSDGSSTQPRALPDLWDRMITEQRGTVTRVYNVSG